MYEVDRQKTKLEGLSYRPQLIDLDNDMDLIPDITKVINVSSGNGQFSKCNGRILQLLLKKFNCKNIMEIGMATTYEGSSSQIIVDYVKRTENAISIGIDLMGKAVDHTYKFLRDTRNIASITKDILTHIPSIDLLLIDGDHSMNMLINDWQYTSLVKEGGVILLHDTNSHPGPVELFHAIDEKLYDKRLCCKNANDCGLAVLIKRTPG